MLQASLPSERTWAFFLDMLQDRETAAGKTAVAAAWQRKAARQRKHQGQG